MSEIVFFGTPELAASVLRGLLGSGIAKVAAVVTQPDRPSGRGQKLQPSPVKSLATAKGIPVFQPKSIRKRSEESGSEQLYSWLESRERPTAFIVVAYGLIIPAKLIDLPSCGIINVHLSLLPRWRGAAPIQRAIMAGDVESGVSIMKIDEGLDTGPVYSMRKIPVTADDDTASLTGKLADIGTAELLARLPDIFSGRLIPTPQPEVGVTYAEKIAKEELVIDWQENAIQIERNLRGLSPAPGARTNFRGELLKIYRGSAITGNNPQYACGTISEVDQHSFTVVAGENSSLRVLEMQLPGKKRLPVSEVLKSFSIEVGEQFL